MSVAWTTVAIILGLLPGVFFFAGLYTRERQPREIVRSSAIGEVAGALVVAILVHVAGFGLLRAIGFDFQRFFWPLVYAVPPDQVVPFAIRRIPKAVFYVLGAASVGYGLGYAASFAMVSRRLRGLLTTHDWIYEVGDAGAVNAYVLTKTSAKDRFILYKGILRYYYFKADGTFSYLVLTAVYRSFMHLDKDAPVTGEPQAIGDPEGGGVSRFLIISGDNIANVVLDKSPGVSALTPEQLEKLLRGIEDEPADAQA